MSCRPPGSSVQGFYRQEYWSGLPFRSPAGLPPPGMEPGSPVQADSLLSEPPDHGSPDHGSHQSVCMDLPSLDIAYKGNHAICSLLWLVSFTLQNAFEACTLFLLYCWIIPHCVDIPHSVFPSWLIYIFCHLHFCFAIMNNVAINY